LKIKNDLDNFKKSLSKEELNKLISNTLELIKYQNSEDSSENLAKIPMIDLKDIKTNPEWYENRMFLISNTTLYYCDQFCNNVIYLDLLFDLRVLPNDLIQYCSLLTSILGNQDTKNYSYSDLEKEILLNC